MPEKPTLAQLSLRIAALSERVASARRLADEVGDHAAMQGLLDYAAEIERQIAELEASAAIRKQAEADANEPGIAALKPPSQPQPDAEPEPEG